LASAKDKIAFRPVKVSQNGFKSEGSAHSEICKMRLSLKSAHGIFEHKNMQFAGVLRLWMPELSFANRLRKSAINKGVRNEYAIFAGNARCHLL
jgi:hypothetical protein